METIHHHVASASIRLYKRIALTFIGLTLVLLGVVLAATLARATVTVTPRPVSVKAEVKISVAKDTKTAETVRGAVASTEISGEASASPAGEGEVVQGQAKGTVMIVNKRATAQTLVATTRLLTKDGVLFRLKDKVMIPPMSEVKDVEVYADQPGQAGEIGPSNFTVPGLSGDLQKLVYAVSEKPMTGGTQTVRVVSQSDIDKVAADLAASLAEKAKATLADKASGFNGSSMLVSESARSVSVKAGDRAESFTVLLKLSVSGVFYDADKLKNLGAAALASNTPSDMELRSSNADDVAVSVQNADPTAGTATLAATFAGEAVITEKSAVLDKSRLVGLDAETIMAYLKSFESVQDAQVKLSPFWVRRAPANQDRITVKMNY
jgi:hypothetical protein